MKKIINKINVTFIHGQEEKAHWTDYLTFYGFAFVSVIVNIIAISTQF